MISLFHFRLIQSLYIVSLYTFLLLTSKSYLFLPIVAIKRLSAVYRCGNGGKLATITTTYQHFYDTLMHSDNNNQLSVAVVVQTTK